MGRITAAGKVLLPLIATGLFVSLAGYVIEVTVPASDIRNAVLLWMWPVGLLGGVAVAWRWLGNPTDNARRQATSRVIEAGLVLATKMREVTDPEGDAAPWRLRRMDWVEDAERVLRDIAPDRLPAFQADMLFASATRVNAPNWIAGELLDLEIQIEQLRQIRVSL